MNPNALRGQIQALERTFAGLITAYEASHGPGGGQPPFKPGRSPVNAPGPPERTYLLCTLPLDGGRLGTVVTYTANDLFLVQLDPGQPTWLGDPQSQNPDAATMAVTNRWLTADRIELR